MSVKITLPVPEPEIPQPEIPGPEIKDSIYYYMTKDDFDTFDVQLQILAVANTKRTKDAIVTLCERVRTALAGLTIECVSSEWEFQLQSREYRTRFEQYDRERDQLLRTVQNLNDELVRRDRMMVNLQNKDVVIDLVTEGGSGSGSHSGASEAGHVVGEVEVITEVVPVIVGEDGQEVPVVVGEDGQEVPVVVGEVAPVVLGKVAPVVVEGDADSVASVDDSRITTTALPVTFQCLQPGRKRQRKDPVDSIQPQIKYILKRGQYTKMHISEKAEVDLLANIEPQDLAVLHNTYENWDEAKRLANLATGT
ncbi:hypothetical protein HK097_002215 [Rhizophlyctis rosea]|uniref:Uncharacterized protein n=1 Tax=Rhizophlyctis rosea TaxID=64517 RepID=A0AAD5X7X4_9FUNG|nr:hypothetical protein HK097_002215 [Rhizophlyctis rosea]